MFGRGGGLAARPEVTSKVDSSAESRWTGRRIEAGFMMSGQLLRIAWPDVKDFYAWAKPSGRRQGKQLRPLPALPAQGAKAEGHQQ